MKCSRTFGWYFVLLLMGCCTCNPITKSRMPSTGSYLDSMLSSSSDKAVDTILTPSSADNTSKILRSPVLNAKYLDFIASGYVDNSIDKILTSPGSDAREWVSITAYRDIDKIPSSALNAEDSDSITSVSSDNSTDIISTTVLDVGDSDSITSVSSDSGTDIISTTVLDVGDSDSTISVSSDNGTEMILTTLPVLNADYSDSTMSVSSDNGIDMILTTLPVLNADYSDSTMSVSSDNGTEMILTTLPVLNAYYSDSTMSVASDNSTDIILTTLPVLIATGDLDSTTSVSLDNVIDMLPTSPLFNIEDSDSITSESSVNAIVNIILPLVSDSESKVSTNKNFIDTSKEPKSRGRFQMLSISTGSTDTLVESSTTSPVMESSDVTPDTAEPSTSDVAPGSSPVAESSTYDVAPSDPVSTSESHISTSSSEISNTTDTPPSESLTGVNPESFSDLASPTEPSTAEPGTSTLEDVPSTPSTEPASWESTRTTSGETSLTEEVASTSSAVSTTETFIPVVEPKAAVETSALETTAGASMTSTLQSLVVTSSYQEKADVGMIAGIIFFILMAGVLISILYMTRHGKLTWPPKIKLFRRTTLDIKPRPVAIKNFPSHCDSMLDTPSRLSSEYQLLGTLSIDLLSSVTFNAGQLPQNKPKNRYTNILPYDKTRVPLEVTGDDPSSDYINASFIKGNSSRVEYIACQGPKEETCSDFWRMVFQYNVLVIVMVTQFEEQSKVKCHHYFPSLRENDVYGDIMVRCTTELQFPVYTVRTIELHRNNSKRKITHLHFQDWPDFGCPLSSDVMLQFVVSVRQQALKVDPGLTLVHCSAGVGRTGTLIAVDILLQQLRHSKTVDIFNTVYQLRKQRTNMVQTEVQYAYIYRCIRDALSDSSYLSKSSSTSENSLDPIYENITPLLKLKNCEVLTIEEPKEKESEL